MKYIIFNPDYCLKPDKSKALLLYRYQGRNVVNGVDDSKTCIIHPIHAMIISFMNGKEYKVCVNAAAKFLNISIELIENFINTLLDNPNQVFIKTGEREGSIFLPKTIISLDEEDIQERYDPSIFEYDDIKLQIERHLTPTKVTLMFNNICYTDCIYCYEDKTIKVNCGIPLQRILGLIREARKLNVVTFDVIGGEFFLYNKWREVLSELRKNDYNPYLSSKMPLNENDVKLLSDLKVRDIQVSLDSAIEEHLLASIKAKRGYVDEMKKFLFLLSKYNIPVMLHTVLTKHNDSIEDMESIYNILKQCSNIYVWHIVKGESTLYPRTDYKNIEISNEALSDIANYLKKISGQANFPIIYPEPEISREVNEELLTLTDKKLEKLAFDDFFSRAACSGLLSSLYILPTGKVTICEQLYWNHPRFYVGDVLCNSLEEIWNSKESLGLFYLKPEDIPSDSLCHTCKSFYKCRNIKQVCYREIIKKYGKDKWYYPDVNCPYVKINTI